MERLQDERDLLWALSRARDLPETLETCLKTALRISGMACGAIYLREEDGSLQRALSRGPSVDLANAACCHPPDAPTTRRVMAGKPVFGGPRLRKTAPTAGSGPWSQGTVAILPIRDGRRIIGCLSMASRASGPTPPQARSALAAIAAAAGSFIVRAQADERLRKSENAFRLVTETLSDVVWMSLPNMAKTVYVSPAYETLWGESCESLYAEPGSFLKRVHPDDRKALVEIVKQHQVRGLPYSIEYRILRPDGTCRWILERGFPVLDAAGSVHLTTGICTDITERKRAEEALRENEARFRVALAAAPIVVFNQDLDLRYTWIGKPTLDLEVEDGIGRTDEELLGPDIAGPLTTIKRRVLETGECGRREVHVARAGKSGWYDLMVEPLRDPDGRVVGITGAAVDISDRRRLEAERTEALARLAAVEEQERHRLSRELHDQTAQRLVALAVELKSLETSLAAGRPYARTLQVLRQGVEDLQLQVRHLAWELRAGEPARRGLETALREFAEEWAEGAGIALDFECRGLGGERLPMVVEATLYRVAQEALSNVQKHAHARHACVLVERDESLARLTVEDDGRGFDADATRNAPEAAQRLGLLGMRERVSLAGGSLLIESAPGAGTTILVRLPIPQEATR